MKSIPQRISHLAGLPAFAFALMVVIAALAGPLFTHSQAGSMNVRAHVDKPVHNQSKRSARESDSPTLSIRAIKTIGVERLPAASANGDITTISIASAGWQPGETVVVSICKTRTSVPDATFNLSADKSGRIIDTKLMFFSVTNGLRYLIAVGRDSEKSVTKQFDIGAPQGGPFVNTYESTCTTFQTSFILGDTVCAQVTAIDTKTFTARFDWIDPDGLVQEMGSVIVVSGQTDTFIIPAAGPNAKVGTWSVQITDVNDGSNLASQSFIVSTGGPQPEAMATFQSDCETAQSSFIAGAAVCAKVTGIDLGEENTFRIDWLRPDNSVAETGPIVTMNNQTDAFTIPSGGPGGTWTVRLTRLSDGATQASASFTVTVIPCQGIFCKGNVSASNDPGQCGATVEYPPPTSDGDCGSITCSPGSGSFFPLGATTVTCTSSAKASCSFTVTVNDTQAPAITCTMNQSASSDPSQCGAVVNYPPPSVSDNCPSVGTPVCSPASGSFFPVGTTTVTCTVSDSSGNTATCTLTVTVVDTQPPIITCPANVTLVTGQNACSAAGCNVVTYALPVASDSCAMVTVVCNPASGSCFPIGVTTVTCTATDASGNTATCAFFVTTFDVALQDDGDPSTILLWNSITGQYRFCCNGITFTGLGKATRQGCVYTLDQTNAIDRRVLGRVDKSAHAGSGSIQAPAGRIRCTITDRNTLNDTNVTSCQ